MMSRKPVVAHLISPLKIYGKEKWLLALLKYIDSEKIKSIVLPLINTDTFSLEAKLIDGGHTYSALRLNKRFSFTTLNEIKRLIIDHDIDILHSHDYRADIYAYLARKTGAKVILISTPHGWSNANNLKLQSYQMLDKLLLRYFDLVLPVSPHMERSLKLVSKSRIKVINNFVDISTLPTPSSSMSKVVSYIGRLSKIKRVEDIIVSLKHMRNRDVSLQIIGEGELESKLRALAVQCGVAERVIFHGFKDNALELLNNSLSLVIPSLTEGLSRITMEAMGMGKPVIGTNIPGISSLIKHEQSGILVEPKNPQAIADAIDRIVDNPTFAYDIGNNAKEHIERYHSARRGAKEYTEIYENTFQAMIEC